MITICSRLFLLFGLGNAIEIFNLPGQPQANFKQYSGYYDVGKDKSRHLHYWFVESQNDPANDPVLLWLSGGPGCSGLSAQLQGFGPFLVNPDGTTLRANPYAWNRNASILTLESPAGTGFSYTSDGNVKTDDRQATEDNYDALVAFFNEFTQFRRNEFYLTGQSYAGVFIPVLAYNIILGKQAGIAPINLKGFAIGNGYVNENGNIDTLVHFVHGHGMTDETQWRRVTSQCCQNDTYNCPFHKFHSGDFCTKFVYSVMDKAWHGNIDPYNMYSKCGANSVSMDVAETISKTRDFTPPLVEISTCLRNNDHVVTYLNRKDVRAALGASFIGKWSVCNNDIFKSYKRMVKDSSYYFKYAIQSGLRVLMYSGDLDLVCNILGGERFSQELGFPVTQIASEYKVNGAVGGYHTKYGKNMEFVTVRGAGHSVHIDQPEIGFHVINSFLNNQKI